MQAHRKGWWELPLVHLPCDKSRAFATFHACQYLAPTQAAIYLLVCLQAGIWGGGSGRWCIRPVATRALPSFHARQLHTPWQIQRFIRSFVCRLVYGVVALNAGVFALWQIPRLRRFMNVNFQQSLPPAPTRLWTMVTCNYSHSGFLHFG